MTLGAPARLAAFAALLVAVGCAAAVVGSRAGIEPAVTDSAMEAMSGAEMAAANGLSEQANGYRLVAERRTFARGPALLAFRVLDADGRAVRSFDAAGGVQLHLIVVRRDLTGYQHLHPRLSGDTWRVGTTFAAAGAYRAYADFEVDGRKTVLGTDLFVPGAFAPARLPAADPAARTDGYDVALSHGRITAGEEATFAFRVTHDGRPVERLDRYVGQRGHLVALHAGDLQYTHVHPHAGGEPGEITFDADLAAPGAYRLFLQFKTGGVVHTAAFTVEVAQ